MGAARFGMTMETQAGSVPAARGAPVSLPSTRVVGPTLASGPGCAQLPATVHASNSCMQAAVRRDCSSPGEQDGQPAAQQSARRAQVPAWQRRLLPAACSDWWWLAASCGSNPSPSDTAVSAGPLRRARRHPEHPGLQALRLIAPCQQPATFLPYPCCRPSREQPSKDQARPAGATLERRPQPQSAYQTAAPIKQVGCQPAPGTHRL